MSSLNSEILFKHCFFVSIEMSAAKYRKKHGTERGFRESIPDNTVKRRFYDFTRARKAQKGRYKDTLISFYSDRSAQGSSISREKFAETRDTLLKKHLSKQAISRLDRFEKSYRNESNKFDRRTKSFKTIRITTGTPENTSLEKFMNVNGYGIPSDLNDLYYFVDFVNKSINTHRQQGKLDMAINNARFIYQCVSTKDFEKNKTSKMYSGMLSYLLECGQKAAFQKEDIKSQLFFRQGLSRIDEKDADSFLEFSKHNADNLIERNRTRGNILEPTVRSFSNHSYDAYLSLRADGLRTNNRSNIIPLVKNAINIARGGAANLILRRGGTLEYKPDNFDSRTIEESFKYQISVLSGDINSVENLIRVYTMLGWAYENEGRIDKAYASGLKAELITRSDGKSYKEAQARVLTLLGALSIREGSSVGKVFAERWLSEAQELYLELNIKSQNSKIKRLLQNI